jgi:hypothetical protein
MVADSAVGGASRSPAIREFLGLPPNRLALAGISFGYPEWRTLFSD